MLMMNDVHDYHDGEHVAQKMNDHDDGRSHVLRNAHDGEGGRHGGDDRHGDAHEWIQSGHGGVGRHALGHARAGAHPRQIGRRRWPGF